MCNAINSRKGFEDDGRRPTDAKSSLGQIDGIQFERLEVWQLALEYIDLIYRIAEGLPRSEEFNLKSQLIRAATSVALNVAEGSTSQSDPEQARFIGLALRSLVESVACLHLIQRRHYVADELFQETIAFSEKLFAKLQAFRGAVLKT